MRFYPAALALSLALAMQSSVSMGQDRTADPRAAALVAEGKAALAAGDAQGAIDALEAALVIDPAATGAYVQLAQAARAQGLQGKAIHYYRIVLDREPRNFAAMAGEGEALLEKGAVERAKLSLSKLESLCGADCEETRELAAYIDAGPNATVLTGEAVTPAASVTQN